MLPGRLAVSELDQHRWGVRTARAEIGLVADAEAAEELARNMDITLMIVRVPTRRLEVAQLLTGRGYILTDTLLYFDRSLERIPEVEQTAEIMIRGQSPVDASAVRRIAEEAFSGYYGHYHADPRLPSDLCDEVYSDWAHRGCLDREVADHVVVAEVSGELIGFGLIKLRGQDAAEGVLYGVHPKFRRRGIYRALVIAAMNWARAQGCRTMLESTQITNLVSQRLWAKLGFQIVSSYYTFHKWRE